MKTKEVRQYALPHADKYFLVDISRHETENGMICENCGKFITNVAQIKSEHGKHFYIGLDCAETLTSVKDSESFEMAKYYMNDVKAACNIFNKGKENGSLTFEKPHEFMLYIGCTYTAKRKNGQEYIKAESRVLYNNSIHLLPAKIKMEAYGYIPQTKYRP